MSPPRQLNTRCRSGQTRPHAHHRRALLLMDEGYAKAFNTLREKSKQLQEHDIEVGNPILNQLSRLPGFTFEGISHYD